MTITMNGLEVSNDNIFGNKTNIQNNKLPLIKETDEDNHRDKSKDKKKLKKRKKTK